MPSLQAVDRRPVGRRPVPDADRLERTRDRELGIDASDVQDRLRLEVEDGRILAAVRDLQDASPAAFVVDQKRLVPLAPQRDGRAGQSEEVAGDLRRIVRGEPRRRCLEDVQLC
jgi:hypothetical protein